MLIGVAVGYLFPDFPDIVYSFSHGSTNIPIAIGLILMMYPPLAKVKYALLPKVFKNTKLLGVSLLLNWIIGPDLMCFLAVIFLKDHLESVFGAILFSIVLCYAMVVDCGD